MYWLTREPTFWTACQKSHIRSDVILFEEEFISEGHHSLYKSVLYDGVRPNSISKLNSRLKSYKIRSLLQDNPKIHTRRDQHL